MKQKVISFYGWTLAIILALIVIHAPLIVFFGTHFPSAALVIKAWKEILMIILLAPTIWLVWQTRKEQKWTRDKLLWLIMVYLALHFVMLLDWHGVKSALAGLSIDLRYVAFFTMIYVLARIAPEWRARLLKIAVVGACIVTGFAVLQLFLPHDFLKVLGYSNETIAPYNTIDKNSAFVREISTLRGPNPLGAYALGVVAIVAAFIGRKKLQFGGWKLMALGVAGIIALYFSFSRSAYVGAVLALLIVLIARFGRLRKFWYWMAGIAIICVIGAIGLVATHPTFVSNVFLHSNPHGGSATKSDQGHASSLINGAEELAAQPLGDGVGSTGSASLLSDAPQIIENQYLLVAHETGWLGLLLFVAIFVIIMKRLWARRSDPWALGIFAAGIGIAFVGLLLPVWTDDTVSMVWWGLAGVMIGGPYARRSAKQKAARTA